MPVGRFCGRRPVQTSTAALGAAVVVALAVAATAGATGTAQRSGAIAFYGGVTNVVTSQTPPSVRPSIVYLTQDGSAVLDKLRWRGWGSSVARATGELSASDCTPSCAAGKRTASPAQVTLSSPGTELGRRVYRCYQVTVPSRPKWDQDECLGRTGSLIAYEPVSTKSKPSPKGWTINVIAGTGVAGYTGDNGKAIKAELNGPQGIAVDGRGDVYVVDQENYRIRKISPSGKITTFAGDGPGTQVNEWTQTGRATSLELGAANDVAVDGRGDVFIATNNMIREVTPNGIIKSFAGSFVAGFAGDGGPATNAKFNQAAHIAVDGKGDLYISDYGNNRIRKVGTNGIITTVAGDGKAGFSGDGGPATKAELNRPQAITVDSRGNLYVCDSGNKRLRKITPAGIISTVAGNGSSVTTAYSAAGRARKVVLYQCDGVAVDRKGDIFVTNGQVEEITNGVIEPIAGRIKYPTLPPDYGGPALKALLGFPLALAVDSRGDVYLSDPFKQRIFKLTQ